MPVLYLCLGSPLITVSSSSSSVSDHDFQKMLLSGEQDKDIDFQQAEVEELVGVKPSTSW